MVLKLGVIIVNYRGDFMSDSKKDVGKGWHIERGKNAKQNRSEYHEHIKVKGYTKSDGTRVKSYRRRPKSK